MRRKPHSNLFKRIRAKLRQHGIDPRDRKYDVLRVPTRRGLTLEFRDATGAAVVKKLTEAIMLRMSNGSGRLVYKFAKKDPQLWLG